FAHRAPRQELVEFLENHHPIRTWPRDGNALETNLALDRLHVPADGLEQRRLAASGRTEQDEPVRLEDLVLDAVGGGDQVVPGLVLKCHAAHIEQRRSRSHRHACHGRCCKSTLPPLMMIPTWRSLRSSAPSSRHARGTAADGSMTIFMRS